MINELNDFPTKIKNNSKQIASNTLVLFLRILLISIANLYAVRLVLKGLGAEDYGIYNAVVGVVMTCSCVFPVLTVAVQRYYSYAIGSGNEKLLKEIFSASINIIALSLLVIIFLFETVGHTIIIEQLQIPPCRFNESILVFHISILTFVFSYLQIPYSAALFSHEDMNSYACISFLDCGLKLIIAQIVGYTTYDHLVFYCIGMSSVSFLTLLCYIAVGKTKFQECKYIIVKNINIYKELLAFSGWTIYGAFAGTTMIQGSSILLNIYFGPLANAAFGIANNIYNAFTSLSNSVILAFRPQMIKSYAANNYKYLYILFKTNNKVILYLLIAIAIPIIIEMDTIMHLWLTNVSDDMILFSQLIIIFTIILAMHNPITTIVQASGKIKYYHLIVETITVLCIPISWILLKTGMPAYSVFISMISVCIIAHMARLVYLQRHYSSFSCSNYTLSIILPGFIVVLFSSMVAEIIHIIIFNNTLRLIVLITTSPILTFAFAYLFGISHKEKVYIGLFAKKIKTRICP